MLMLATKMAHPAEPRPSTPRRLPLYRSPLPEHASHNDDSEMAFVTLIMACARRDRPDDLPAHKAGKNKDREVVNQLWVVHRRTHSKSQHGDQHRPDGPWSTAGAVARAFGLAAGAGSDFWGTSRVGGGGTAFRLRWWWPVATQLFKTRDLRTTSSSMSTRYPPRRPCREEVDQVVEKSWLAWVARRQVRSV